MGKKCTIARWWKGYFQRESKIKRWSLANYACLNRFVMWPQNPTMKLHWYPHPHTFHAIRNAWAVSEYFIETRDRKKWFTCERARKNPHPTLFWVRFLFICTILPHTSRFFSTQSTQMDLNGILWWDFCEKDFWINAEREKNWAVKGRWTPKRKQYHGSPTWLSDVPPKKWSRFLLLLWFRINYIQIYWSIRWVGRVRAEKWWRRHRPFGHWRLKLQ